MLVHYYVQLWCVLALALRLSCASYVSHPNINFNALDKLFITGSYDGISIYKDTDQLTHIPKKTSSVISLSNDTLKLLASSNIDGTIYDSCVLSDSIYFAGNFSTVNGASVNNIASFNLTNNSLKTLKYGLDGPVYTLYCDTENQQLYAGGSFVAPVEVSMESYTNSLSQFGGSVALWKNNKWSGLPWKGFNGPVYSIAQRESTKTIFFGGQFDGTTDGQIFYAPGSRPIALSSTNVVATGTASGSADPSSIVCAGESNSKSWYLPDNTNGTWQVAFASYSVNPTLIRIVNSKTSDRQTKGFSVRSLSGSTVYQLRYFDPSTNTTKTCSTNCVLLNDPKVTYQDFRITNTALTNGIAIDIKSWYGKSGGLSSVQVFQSEIFTYAANSDSTNVCLASLNSTLSKVTTSGDWAIATDTPSYLIASVSSSKRATATFHPNILESGIYQVLIYSPACSKTACSDRTSVNIAIAATPSTKTNVTANQNSANGQQVFTGYFEVSDSFSPSLTFSLASNVTVKSGSSVNIIAHAVQFVKVPSSGALSSIVQYNYSQKNVTVTSIPWGVLNDNIPTKSSVYSFGLLKNDIYIGGSFSGTDSSSSAYSNIVIYEASTNKLKALSGNGVNGAVESIAVNDNTVFIGGNFTSLSSGNSTVKNLNYVAQYDAQKSTWDSLAGGVNGPVSSVISLDSSNMVLVSGRYSQLLKAKSSDSNEKVSGVNFWDIKKQKFDTSSKIPYLSGVISSAFTYKNKDYFIGSIKSAQRYHAEGLSYITPTHTDSIALLSSFVNNDLKTSTSVTVGSYNKTNNNEIAVFGGQFTLANNIQNLAIYDNGAWAAFKGADWKGTLHTMETYNDLLYVGGSFTSASLSGLAVFSLTSRSLLHAPAIKSVTGSDSVKINVIRVVPEQNAVIIGGSFGSVESVSCVSICSMDIKTLQWTSLTSGISGEIVDVQYIGGKLIATGSLVLNSSPLLIAQYDFKSAKWGPLGSADLPGPSQILSYDNITQSIYISGTINNSTYLRKWNGQKFVSLTQDLGPGSVISNLAMLPLVNNGTSSKIKQNVLLASGFINLGTCNVSSAFYNDDQGWIPYLVASTADGSIGSSLLSSIFSKTQPYIASKAPKTPMSKSLVILVSVVSSLGIVFLIVLCAMLAIYFKKKRNPKVDPRSAMYNYYSKPPQKPESLLAMLKEKSPDDDSYSDFGGKGGAEKSEVSHEEFYNIAATVSTEHLQEQKSNRFVPPPPIDTRAPVSPPPHAYNSQPYVYDNQSQPYTNQSQAYSNIQNQNYQGPFSASSNNANANMSPNNVSNDSVRPESYARPYSEIQRDSNTSSFYNNEYALMRDKAESPRNYSPYNPFRSSEVGVAVSDNTKVVGAAVGSALVSTVDSPEKKQQQTRNIGPSTNNQLPYQVNYSNIQPPVTSNLNADNQPKPEGLRWTTAPEPNVSTAVIKPVSIIGDTDTYNIPVPPVPETNITSSVQNSNIHSNEVRWTTAPPPNVGAAVIKPVSVFDPIPVQGNKSPGNLNVDKNQKNEVRWTTSPSGNDAISKAVVIPVPTIVTDEKKDESKALELPRTMNNSNLSVNLSTTTLNTLPPSSNARWTNYNADEAISHIQIEPVSRDSAFNSYYGGLNSTSALDLGSSSLSFASDPDFAKFTIQSDTNQEDNSNSLVNATRASKNQYIASLSSLAIPEADSDDDIEETSRIGATASNSNTYQEKSTKPPHFDSVINTEVFRMSDPGYGSPVDSDNFDQKNNEPPSPDSSVRWKTANIGSPIETAYASNIMEPATATVTTRQEMENPFDTYYKVQDSKKDKEDFNPEPIGRKSETLDDAIANRDLNALSFLISEQEPLPIQTQTQKKNEAKTEDTKISGGSNRAGTPSTINVSAEGRASSKRMVEKYFESRKTIVGDKRPKYKSDFKSIMEAAFENNTKTPVATEDNPHLYYAKFEFSAREHGELGFTKNSPIIVVDNSDDIWWMGYKADQTDGSYIQGVFPSNYVEIALSLRH